MGFTVVVFILVYMAMGLGKVPGFRIDRTGAAVVGGLAMIAAGSISPKAAWDAMSYETLGLLFGLMVISGAFTVAGFYAWAAEKVASLPISPVKLLAVFIVVSGGLSSVLTNDVVVVAMTPLLVSITLARGLNPIPFLLGFCFSANAGSLGSLIGSPKNMIAAQALDISFMQMLKLGGLPALVAMLIIWCFLAYMYRGKWMLEASQKPTQQPAASRPLDVRETIKASVVLVATVIAFIADIWPQEIVALTAAGILLINRSITSTDVLKEVDGNLLLLLMGLFVVNAAMSATGLPQELLTALKGWGVGLDEPVPLYFTSALLSKAVSNNPAVMLLVPYLTPGPHAEALCAALVLGAGLSSNMLIFGSLAGIVVVEQAKLCGVTISFSQFSKAGVPVASLCLLLGAFWVYWL